ncbi:Uncharacterised protein [Mycobacteroides abscessus subsp. abscessus]|uniref:hypothetical protein n=1 Tax=Mycobacteroides abscessus TaxID=36809 RepID=UPI0009D4CEE3|nr:hypothetical protein [Mycobacteroides abscessus]SKR41503.1 Uncharacterised protein [Mycobacteroides abscessus subsp. abscessus]
MRRRTPTAQNRVVARELMRSIPKTELEEFRDVIAPMQELAEAAPETITAEAAMDALAALRAHRPVLEARLWHLLGAAVLEGVPPTYVAANAHVAQRTLTRHLATGPAQWCGKVLVADPRRVYGWRAE